MTLTPNGTGRYFPKEQQFRALVNNSKEISMPSDLPQLWSDEERWQVLMENVKDFGIFMLDPDGQFATWNLGAERLLGYHSNEIVGQHFSVIFTTDDLQLSQPDFELREAREKGRCEDERWHVRSDGSKFWASGILTPLWSEDGTLRGYAKIIRDMTDRRMAELNVADANRRKDEFLAVLSHEFRSPLAAITSAAQLISMTAQDQTVHDASNIIERQAGDLTRMVDDLLDIARIGRGTMQLQRKSVELNELIHHALQTVQPQIESRQHQLEVALSEEPVWVDADPQRLSQAISNVLVNAAKYTDAGGLIQVSSELDGIKARIQVKDNGSGILADMLTRIFDTFVQADRSLSNSNGGLGLGLALVKRIVEMHGGTVEAFSDGIGKGSEFVIQLPTIRHDPPAALPATPKLTTASDAKGLNILLAEDNQDAGEMLALVLRKTGHVVSIVATGSDALQRASELKPDVLILDIGLPGIDGYRVAELIRRQDEFQSTLLIALTGYAQPDDLERARQSGFDYHLVKPVDIEMLRSLLRTRSGAS